jgi:hypothetical protein
MYTNADTFVSKKIIDKLDNRFKKTLMVCVLGDTSTTTLKGNPVRFTEDWMPPGSGTYVVYSTLDGVDAQHCATFRYDNTK